MSNTNDEIFPPWQFALLAAEVFAVAPHALGGIDIQAFPGPVRDYWLEQCQTLMPERIFRKLPLNISESRLLGGLNFAATAKSGKPVMEQGLLAECHENVVVVPMAERAERRILAHVTQSLDSGRVALQRDGFSDHRAAEFGVLALNEGLDDEPLSAALIERLALQVRLNDINVRQLQASRYSATDIACAQSRWRQVDVSTEHLERVVLTTLMLGVGSARAVQFAVAVAKICAAISGREQTDDTSLEQAIALTLGHRATQLPATEDNAPPSPHPEPESEPEQPPSHERQQNETPSQDQVLEATYAVIPPELLRKLAASHRTRTKQRTVGKSGTEQLCLKRGRPCGTIAGDPRRGGKLQLIATLRAAAPWQGLRNKESAGTGSRLVIRKQDLRLTRYRHRSESTTVFVVDASGSAAMHRLGEAKGAVELLLADCYSRRDSVALISFRGVKAELLLPPTRSLVRAKRALAALPGGGGTPLAHAIDTANRLAEQIKRGGSTPAIVLLTDGVANINLQGDPGRDAANADALDRATAFRLNGINALLIDTSLRGHDRARTIADALDAQYVRLPQANAQALFDTVRAHV